MAPSVMANTGGVPGGIGTRRNDLASMDVGRTFGWTLVLLFSLALVGSCTDATVRKSSAAKALIGSHRLATANTAQWRARGHERLRAGFASEQTVAWHALI